MIEIRTLPSVQRWVENAWQNIGGQVLAAVEANSLEGADLSGRKLNFAALGGANLRQVNFNRATLDGADLSHADLTGACFCVATLTLTRLQGALLDEADLSGAFMAGAHLEGADLRGARLQVAKLGSCVFDETTRWPEGFDPWEHGAGPSIQLERRARERMSAGMTPEEYAGRYGHTILLFGSTQHQFRDPTLTRWMRRLGVILADAQLLAECRQKFLTPQELEEIQRAEEDALE